MSETKERSGIFKFFYIFLSIITFPIFAVLFVLRHPLWVLIVLLLLAGGAAYWPMSQHNVALTDVVDWYKNQYQTTKLDIAKKAIEEGKSGYVPQAVLDEMKKIEEDAKEAALPKGENYNAKVARDKKSEDMKASLKQRGGFKKKAEEKSSDADATNAENTEENGEIEVMAPKSGGLSALLPISKVEENVEQEETEMPSTSQEPSSDNEDDMELF